LTGVASVDRSGIDALNAARISSSRADGWDSRETYGAIAWTPDGRLVFTSEESGNGDIWIMNADGSGRRQLTTDPHWDTGPSVSTDGRTIAFMSRRTNTESIWLMDIDGSNQRRATHRLIERMPEFSPDGKWLYYNSWETGTVTVWRMPVSGGEPEQVSTEIARIKRLSADGQAFLYGSSATDLAIAKTSDSSILQRFPFPGTNISWVPGENAISYIKETAGVPNIWIRNLGTGKTRQLTHFDSEGVVTYDWSRDGKRIAYARGAAASDVIVITLSK
jgi:Tol biopolymer transport system component